MTDIFISYASEDRERARTLASALEGRGWSVWWDRKIVAGQSFDQVIERELYTAKSVVVLWSNDSISSEWVKNEAAAAAERSVLVPALIDNVKLPLEFRRKQTADLIGWVGDLSDLRFQALCDGIAATTTGVLPSQPVPPPPRGHRWNRRWTLGAILVIAISLVLGLYLVLSGNNLFPPFTGQTPKPQEETPAPSTQSGPRDEIYNSLSAAQRKGVKMLQQGKPEALAYIDDNLKQVNEAIKAFPDDARFYYLKGYVLKDVYQSPISKSLLPVEKRREYLSLARKSAEQALQLDENSVATHNLMGNILYFEGDCDAAIKEYNIALQLNREDDYKRVIEGDKQLCESARQ